MTPAEREARKQAEDERHRPTPLTERQAKIIAALETLTDEELAWLDKELTVLRFERKLRK